MKKAAFVEMWPWHTECIYSQLLYLKTAGYYVELICHENHRDKVSLISPVADKTTFYDFDTNEAIDSARDYIIESSFDKVIIGTVGVGNVKRLLDGDFPAVTEFYGVMHDLRAMRLRRRGKFIGKIKDFFVLADYIADNFPKRKRYTCRATPFMFQPDYPDIEIEKPDGHIWIAIPGEVNFHRRDYMALIPPEGETYNKNVRFVLLGYGGGEQVEALRKTLRERDIEENFVFFDDFVNPPEFYSWLRRCDYVMLLIHKGCGGFDNYLKKKITGSLNAGLTLRIPMLCDVAFSKLDDYRGHSIFYARKKLARMANSLSKPDIKDYYNDEFERTHSLEALSKRYTSFIER